MATKEEKAIAGVTSLGTNEIAFEIRGRLVELFIVSGDSVTRVHVQTTLLFLVVAKLFLFWLVYTLAGLRIIYAERAARRKILGR